MLAYKYLFSEKCCLSNKVYYICIRVKEAIDAANFKT